MKQPVLIGGVFDPLHAGHLAYIEEAKKYGWLICALSDAPHKHQPLVPLQERSALLKALGVDVIVGGSVLGAIETLQPTKYIKGKDWEGKLPTEEIALCHELCIEIIYTDTMRQSSSALLADYERKRTTEKLAAFEAFVGQQTPAEKPWVPVTDYSRETRREIEAPHADRIVEAFDLLGCRPRSVLDVGCGTGALMGLLSERGVYVHGIDKNRGAGGNCTRADIAAWNLNLASDCHLVICREVLEHLTAKQLAVAVRNLVKLSMRFIYVTTRFTAKSHLLDVDGSDDLDPTHMTMLNQDLLRTLFVLEGCTRRPDLEEKLDHMKKGRCLVYEVPA